MAAGRRVTVLGLVLLAAYLAQASLGLEPAKLASLQDDERYRIGSGVVLGLYLLYQARLGSRRVFDPVGSVARHKLAGALAPLVLYLHATRPGYGYLVVLVSLYLGTVLAGLAHGRVIAARARRLFAVWFVVHVAMSTLLVVFGGYHVVVALAYE